jgi:peptidoglycan L-alanyl-D-glutamate endopeptidase CwlK
MNLPETIKAIQRAVGADPDGVFGAMTAARVLGELKYSPPPVIPRETVIALDDGTLANLDARTVKNLLTLDPKARDRFISFALLANATAATYGCTYILIGGNRTWEEQDALYAQGRKGDKRPIVTQAKGGQSNHNFGIAGDFGVFRGKSYLDDANPELASKVHKACSLHAAACGLEWGGSWKSIKDEPHYEISTGLSMMQKRNVYRVRGSVL